MPEPDVNPPAPSTEGDIGAIRDDLERIAAHLVPFLKSSYADTLARLDRAERQLASRRDRPVIAGIHDVLCSVRRLQNEPNLGGAVEELLVNLLDRAGYREFGDVGDDFDPAWYEAIGGETERGRGRVVRVYRRGLACYGDLFIRASVEVGLDPPPAVGPTASLQPITLSDTPSEGGI